MIELLLCFTFITHDLFNDFLKDGYYTIRLVLYLTKQSSFDLRQKIRVSTKNKSVDKNKSFTGKLRNFNKIHQGKKQKESLVVHGICPKIHNPLSLMSVIIDIIFSRVF